MAQKQTTCFLDLNYNSIRLSEDKQVAILDGVRDETNVPIVYLNRPLAPKEVIHLRVEHQIPSSTSAHSFVLGCTSCDVVKIRSEFYHTFSLCREDFMCQGTVRTIDIPRKIESVSLVKGEDGRVIVKNIDHSDGSHPFEATLDPPSDRATFFVAMSGCAARLSLSDEFKPPGSLASMSQWIFSKNFDLKGDRLSRCSKNRDCLAYMVSPMRVDSSIDFRITRVDKTKTGSFTFGLMKCNPRNAGPTTRLPEDSCRLRSSRWDDVCMTCHNPLPSPRIDAKVKILRLESGIVLQYGENKIPIFKAIKLGRSDWYPFIYLSGAIDEIQFISRTKATARSSSKSKPQCAVCKHADAEFIILPCGHFGLCQKCSEERKFADCIACRTKVMTLIRLIPMFG